jgi:hypothetical protein
MTQPHSTESGAIFLDFFSLLRLRGLRVSISDWFVLLDALDRGLAGVSLTQFYYTSRSILTKTEADFDRFDLAFSEFFRGVEHHETLPPEVLKWLTQADPLGDYDKEEVDGRTRLELAALRKMFRERLQEQDARHDSGKYWIGTGGTSVMGHSGYSASGIRVGGEGRNRHALQVVGDRLYRDFRDDSVFNVRQFQIAFRRLRQLSARLDEGPRDELDLDETITETCNNAGHLKVVYRRPRTSSTKLMLLFDSGGSMWPFARLCNLLFQSVSRSNHFRTLKAYYFHNCFYERLFISPECRYDESIETEWVLQNCGNDYKVIIVGDAAMAPTELLFPGGNMDYEHFNKEPGLLWVRRFVQRYEKLVWLNPLPEEEWAAGNGFETISLIRDELQMYPLTIKGLEAGLKSLVAAR